MGTTFKELNLPVTAFENGCVVLYKVWLDSLVTKHTEKTRVDAYEMNIDNDIYGLSEEAAIVQAFNAYGLDKVWGSIIDKMFITSSDPNNEPDEHADISAELHDREELGQPSSLVFSNSSEGDKFLNEHILTIAKITLDPESLEDSVIVLPEGTENPTPEMTEPYYDPAAGTLHATVAGRIHNIDMSHNRILTLKLDKDLGGMIKVTEISIEEVQLN